ncbi:hypothetical protein [Limosilactobacillus caecicola]|uniref:hypothetical protein n=1 Tax=Limosilactobacillus caecicola TaxID=2941332 RepID=UPI00203F4939|nr:hypothetical protein [Limosilactobacillus caecicola]
MHNQILGTNDELSVINFDGWDCVDECNEWLHNPSRCVEVVDIKYGFAADESEVFSSILLLYREVS